MNTITRPSQHRQQPGATPSDDAVSRVDRGDTGGGPDSAERATSTRSAPEGTTMNPAAHPLAAFDALVAGAPAPSWLTQHVIPAWGFAADRVSITLIAVSENATFRVSIDGSPVSVLRVHRPGYFADPTYIDSEMLWLEALTRDTEVSVPRVIPLSDGQRVLRFSENGSEWFAAMFEFIPGHVIESIDDPTPYYRPIGALAARLHEHSRAFRLPAGNSRFSWDIPDMLGDTSRWGDWRAATSSATERQLLERAESAALELVSNAPRTSDTWGLIHADLRPSNIMTRGDELFVIDFDDCGFGWYTYDFASALSFIEHEEYAPRIAREWIAGYRTVADFSEADVEHGCALSMLRRLTMLGWTTTHRADALPGTLAAEQLPGTLTVAERFLDDPTWLMH